MSGMDRLTEEASALNPVGVAFIAVTWPNQIRCARADAGCSPLPPAWMAPYLFSIGERQ